MDSQLNDVLNNKVVIEKVESSDARGGTTYQDPVNVSCYMAGEQKMVRDMQGQEVVSTLSLFISDTDAAKLNLKHTDRITLPDGRQPPIIAIGSFFDERGKLFSIEVNL